MELRVNDYVRTKDGTIEKYSGTNDSEIENFTLNEIVKSSPNIIDLIEVGDYVNGYRVDYIENINKNNNFILQRIFCEEYEKDLYSKSFKPSDIKSIVTKEQFESMKYKVGD